MYDERKLTEVLGDDLVVPQTEISVINIRSGFIVDLVDKKRIFFFGNSHYFSDRSPSQVITDPYVKLFSVEDKRKQAGSFKAAAGRESKVLIFGKKRCLYAENRDINDPVKRGKYVLRGAKVIRRDKIYALYIGDRFQEFTQFPSLTFLFPVSRIYIKKRCPRFFKIKKRKGNAVFSACSVYPAV